MPEPRRTSTISSHTLIADLVGSPVAYRVLWPSSVGNRTGKEKRADGLPLLLLLHGGGGSAEFLDTLRPLFDELWADGTLPPLVVATPSAGLSFYLDRFDGLEQWERFLREEFVPHVIDTTGGRTRWHGRRRGRRIDGRYGRSPSRISQPRTICRGGRS